MLKGYDTSHHQTDDIFNYYLGIADFMIIKATEGRTYKDPEFINRIEKIKHNLCGVYHYARPENNSVVEEVKNFLSVVQPHLTDTMLIVLDWEGNSINHPFTWALEWCSMVEEQIGRKPIIYASASVIKKYETQYSLWWTAHYNIECKNGCAHDSVSELLTQYTNNPIDIDIFHGSHNDWIRLCGNTAQNYNIVAEWTEGNKKYKVICEEVVSFECFKYN